jgi:hypothetical protein
MALLACVLLALAVAGLYALRQHHLAREEAQRQEEVRQREQVHQGRVNDLVRVALATGDPPRREHYAFRTRLVIWDKTQGFRKDLMDLLPTEWWAGLDDAEFTVVIIRQQKEELVADYRYDRPPSGNFLLDSTPGYRVDLDVCVVDRPSREIQGAVTVRANDPPAKISRRGGEEFIAE